MDLYTFNKTIMNGQEPLENSYVKNKMYEIAREVNAGDDYWMLLNREKADYSLFLVTTKDDTVLTANEILETIQNRGKVLGFEKLNSGAWEIWIREHDSEESLMYMLFPYNFGIIEIKSED